MTPAEQAMNERVERDLRMLIGDMHVQLVVLRAQLEQAQTAAQMAAQAAVKPNGGGPRPETRT